MLESDAVARFLVTAFFAIVFGQSAFDKVTDQKGNAEFFVAHFKNTPLEPHVPLLFWALTLLEATAGGLCALGLFLFDFRWKSFGIAGCGVALSAIALLALLLGQRLAKDYAGAAVIAGYFAVALIGLSYF